MQKGKSTVGLEGLDHSREQGAPQSRGQIERRDIYLSGKTGRRPGVWFLIWVGVSRYMTLRCPCHLSVGQSGVSKMAMEQRAEPGDGLPAQAFLPQLPTVAHVTISSVFPAAWRVIHTSHGLRCFLTVAH